jgi:hypothetical protein
MEPLWSPGVATDGNQRQIDKTRKAQKQGKSVATGCHRLPETFHGKEGVSGSSPEEGSHKSPANGAFAFPIAVHFLQRARVWNRFWNSQAKKAPISLSNQTSEHGSISAGEQDVVRPVAVDPADTRRCHRELHTR